MNYLYEPYTPLLDSMKRINDLVTNTGLPLPFDVMITPTPQTV